MLSKKQLLGHRIKELREKKKYTQEKLSEKVGIDSKHLSRIENGRNYPSIETLEKIVDSLGVTFEEVFQTEHLENREILINNLYIKLQQLFDKNLKFIYKIIIEL